MVFQIVVQSEYENFRLIYVKIKLQLPRRQLCNSFRTFAAHDSRLRNATIQIWSISIIVT